MSDLWEGDDSSEGLRARPSAAFEAAEGGVDEVLEATGELGERVDDLFNKAVERQVAEQRNLNRLVGEVESAVASVRSRIDELQRQVARDVGPTSDKLNALDAGIRSLRETLAAQGVAIRAELQEAVAAVREDSRSRNDLLTGEVGAVRQLEGELEQRMAGLRAAVETGVERLDARQGSLAEDLARVSSRLTDAAEAAEDTRESLGPVTNRLEQAVALLEEQLAVALKEHRSAVDEQIGRLAQTIESRLGELGAIVGSQLQAQDQRFSSIDQIVQQAVTRAVEDLRDPLTSSVRDALSSEAHASRLAVDEQLASTRESLESQLRTNRQAIDERLGDVLAEVHSTTSTLAERLTSQLLAVTEGNDELGDAVRSALSQVRGDLDQQLANHRAQLEADATSVREELQRHREEVAGHSETLRTDMAGAQKLLAERSEQMRVIVNERMDELRSKLDERLDTFSALVDERTAQMTSDVTARQRDSLEAITERTDLIRDQLAGQVESIRADLRDQLEKTEASRERTMSTLAEQREMIERQTSDLDGLTTSISELVQSRVDEFTTALREHLDTQRAEVLQLQMDQRAGVREQLDRQSNTIEDLLESQVRESRSQLAEHRELIGQDLRQQREVVDAVAEQMMAASRAVAAELAELEGFAAYFQQSRVLEEEARDRFRVDLLAAFEERFEQGLVRLRDRIEDGFAAMRSTVDGAASGIDTRLDDLTAGVSGRIEESLVNVNDRVSHALGDLESRVGESLGAVGRNVDHVRQELASFDRRLGGVEGDVTRQADRLDTMGEDVSGMGTTVGEVLRAMQAEIVETQNKLLADAQLSMEESELRLVRSRELFDGAAHQIEAKAQTLERHLAEALDRVAASLREEQEVTLRQLRAVTREIESQASEIDDRVTSTVSEAAGSLRGEQERALQELRATVAQLEDSFTGLRHLEASMVSYLEARDHRLEEERLEVMRELVAELAEGMSRRERRKVSTRLDQIVSEVVPRPTPAGPAPDGSPSERLTALTGSAPPMQRRPRPLDEEEAVIRPRALAEDLPADEEYEEPAAPPRTPRQQASRAPAARKAAKKSTARKPAKPKRTTGEAALQRLGEIKGVGPSKQEALLAAFGSIEAIRDATFDELVAVNGVGPALAEQIQQDLHAS